MSFRKAFLGCLLFAALATPVPAWSATGSAAEAVDGELQTAKASMMAMPQSALIHAAAAAKLAASLPPGQNKETAIISADWLRGEALTRVKQPQQALPVLQAALDHVSKSSPASKLHGDVLKSHGRAEQAIGRVDKALEDFQAAYAMYQKAKEPRARSHGVARDRLDLFRRPRLRARATILRSIGGNYQSRSDAYARGRQ